MYTKKSETFFKSNSVLLLFSQKSIEMQQESSSTPSKKKKKENIETISTMQKYKNLLPPKKKRGNKIRKFLDFSGSTIFHPLSKKKKRKQASISNLVSKHLATLAKKENLPRYGIDSR